MKCFFEEGRALAKINHPNVVRVLNFFRANETVYMVMRYERGRTLQQQIQMRAGPDVRALRPARVHAAAERPARSAHAQAAAPRHQAGQHLPAHRRQPGAARLRRGARRRSRPTDRSSRRCTRRASPRPSNTATRSAGAMDRRLRHRRVDVRVPRGVRAAGGRRARCRRTTSCRPRRSGRASIRTTCSR